MTDGYAALTAPRLLLVPATIAMITAELEDADQLARVIDANVPPDWLPEHHDIETLAFWRDALRQPGADGWWLHQALLRDSGRPTLVGSVGYKGPPVDGVLEIGYSIVGSWRRRGLATEACQALVDSAWRRGAEVVVAQTLDGLEPSIGVLIKLGFAQSDPPEPGVLEFTLRREGRSSVG